MPYDGPGIYKHFKGTLYYATDLALKEDDLEVYVAYQPFAAEHGEEKTPLQEARAGFWIRKRSSFDESVDGKPRFEKIHQDP